MSFDNSDSSKKLIGGSSNAGKISSAYENLMQKININSSLPEVFKMQMDASNPLDEIKLYEKNICKDN